jgi:hypothetical protein
VFFVMDGRQYNLVAVDGDTQFELEPSHLDKCVWLDSDIRLEQYRLFNDLREDDPEGQILCALIRSRISLISAIRIWTGRRAA